MAPQSPYHTIVVIAQALAEYGALAAVVDAFNYAYARVEQATGQWGVEGVIVLVAAVVVWRIVAALR